MWIDDEPTERKRVYDNYYAAESIGGYQRKRTRPKKIDRDKHCEECGIPIPNNKKLCLDCGVERSDRRKLEYKKTHK